MLRWIKLICVFLIIGVIVYFSFVKINEIIIKDIKVVNLDKIYKEKGFPITVKRIERLKDKMFVKDIAIIKKPNSALYESFISPDLIKDIHIGSLLAIPNTIKVDGVETFIDNSAPYISGKVMYIDKNINWQTGFYRIDIKLNEKPQPSTFYTGKIVFKEISNVIAVPITYLQPVGDNYYAWIVKDNQSEQVDIKTGLCDGYACSIVSGLRSGDLVVTSDTKKLYDGMKVNITNDNESQIMRSAN